MRNFFCIAVFFCFMAMGCSPAHYFVANKKYSPQQLQKDYALFRNILEDDHPGLYWYTPKDSMDLYFEKGAAHLQDSLTEAGFRNVLRYVIAKIHCGHTSVQPSKHYDRIPDSLRNKPFPLSLKIWKDTAIVAANLNRTDSNVVKGVIVTAIDDKPIKFLVDSMFDVLPADGYNLTHKYQTLSNRGVFGNLYQSIFGYHNRYKIDFVDTLGRSKTAMVKLYTPVRDTTRRAGNPKPPKGPNHHLRKKMELLAARNIRKDSMLPVVYMDLNTFTKDARLRPFFKRSFKEFKKEKTQNLVIDLRGNGGGSVTNSNLLTRYITSEPFKVGDSLYAINRSSRYSQYQQHRFFNWLFLVLMTHKAADDKYHFRYFEKKVYKPKKHNHFDGQVYILTGGNTFSAATLVAHALKGQPHITLVGEETGGGAYGNNAWLIPDVTLPITKVRFRLPLFRLVINKNEPKGWGVMPDVAVPPTAEAIRQNKDFKMEKVQQLIKEKSSVTSLQRK